MKKLPIDFGELGMAFEDASWQMNYYLDLETGQVVWISDEIRSQLEDLYEQAYDPDSEEPEDLAGVLHDQDLPDWEKEELLEAAQIDRLYGTRYISVPTADSHEGYRDMERFIQTVQDERLQDRLWRAIHGRGAFRRFKDVLAADYHEEKRWYTFKDDLLEERIRDWLESEGIEPIVPEPAPADDLGPPTPTPRQQLLAEVLAFVQVASRLPGVTRIALIGSLATEQPDPKDADLLVSVSATMDLEPLATLARKLHGHAQSLGRGADVFLADPSGHYLGRTCPWKRCGPGIRLSCDALHCGRRLYLHDDLQIIRLDDGLVAAPPIDLWPQVTTRLPVPPDVDQRLLSPLRSL
jgi:predicted nucleotidyltransferase